jgi:hypothetical protein
MYNVYTWDNVVNISLQVTRQCKDMHNLKQRRRIKEEQTDRVLALLETSLSSGAAVNKTNRFCRIRASRESAPSGAPAGDTLQTGVPGLCYPTPPPPPRFASSLGYRQTASRNSAESDTLHLEHSVQTLRPWANTLLLPNYMPHNECLLVLQYHARPPHWLLR